MHPPRRITLWHLLMNDPAADGHPLHITGTDDAVVAHAVAMLHGSRQHIGDGLDAPMRVPRKSCQIVFRNIVAKVVEQKEGIKVPGIAKTECPPQMHPGTFERRFRLAQSLNRSDRHRNSSAENFCQLK